MPSGVWILTMLDTHAQAPYRAGATLPWRDALVQIDVRSFLAEDRSTPSNLRDRVADVADRVKASQGRVAGIIVDVNLGAARHTGFSMWRRQDRIGLLVVEVLRLDPGLAFPVYAYSFESPRSLKTIDAFGLLFDEFADCNRFLRLPICGSDPSLRPPDERRLQALAEILRSRQQKRRAAETVATVRDILSRFAHNERADLTALVGPVKAALRAGCYDLAAAPEKMERVQSSLGQLKAEANSMTVESLVKGAVLAEITRLESLWGSAAQAIDRFHVFSGSPETEWVFRPEEALEKVAAFEERIRELQRG